MADTDWTSPHALIGALQKAPYEFDFFQAMRLLECAYHERPRLGESLRPLEDAVRLGQEPTMAFAPSTLAACVPGKKGLPPRLNGYFFGLFGPNGPLPLHLTEFARGRARNFNDPTLVRFADVFHHRMLCLFYRAWARSQPTVSLDRGDTDYFANYLGTLFGIGMPSLRNRDALPDFAKLHYAGHMAGQSKHPEGLRSMVQGFFGLRARVNELVGEWMALPVPSVCRLGRSTENGTLGETLVVGERVWGGQHKFRLVLGAMGFRDYQRMLPGGESLIRLIAMVRGYVGDELKWEVNLILRREEVPPLKLDGSLRLGWTTWAGERREERDADDLVLNPMAYQAYQGARDRAAAAGAHQGVE